MFSSKEMCIFVSTRWLFMHLLGHTDMFWGLLTGVNAFAVVHLHVLSGPGKNIDQQIPPAVDFIKRKHIIGCTAQPLWDF